MCIRDRRGRSFLSSVNFTRSRSNPNIEYNKFQEKERRGKSKDRAPSPEHTVKSNKLSKKKKATKKAKSIERAPLKVATSATVAPSMSRYALPFNPTTGCCNIHPHIALAEKNGQGRGGWTIVTDVCPACAR